jgi:hypothetical protein
MPKYKVYCDGLLASGKRVFTCELPEHAAELFISRECWEKKLPYNSYHLTVMVEDLELFYIDVMNDGWQFAGKYIATPQFNIEKA